MQKGSFPSRISRRSADSPTGPSSPLCIGLDCQPRASERCSRCSPAPTLRGERVPAVGSSGSSARPGHGHGYSQGRYAVEAAGTFPPPTFWPWRSFLRTAFGRQFWQSRSMSKTAWSYRTFFFGARPLPRLNDAVACAVHAAGVRCDPKPRCILVGTELYKGIAVSTTNRSSAPQPTLANLWQRCRCSAVRVSTTKLSRVGPSDS